MKDGYECGLGVRFDNPKQREAYEEMITLDGRFKNSGIVLGPGKKRALEIKEMKRGIRK